MKTQRIAQLYDDPGPFASVFVDVSKDSETGESHQDLKVREALETIAAEGAPDDLVDLIRSTLGRTSDTGGPTAQAVVATERGVLLDDLVSARLDDTTGTWDVLPDLAPWLAYADQSITFVLGLVDHEGGQVITYDSTGHSSGRGDVDHPDPHEHKTRGGGLAHRRYQRTAENAWARNAEAVAQLLTSRISDGARLVLLAGDPTSRSQVRQALGDQPSVELVELDHGGRTADGGDEALYHAVNEVVSDELTARRVRLVHDFEKRLGSDDSAVVGVSDAADAFVRGQVASLLLDPDAAHASSLDPRRHPGLELAQRPIDGPVRADRGLIAAAARTGADVHVIPSRAMRDALAAALLRWEGAPKDA